MIYDCFTFYDELDLLELRLETLDAVVDRFVLCEAPFTFRGEPKPLTFAGAAQRFARWRERIVPLVYPHAASPNPWLNEWGQRDYLAAGLSGCGPEDLVMIGDCDEIPDPANVARRPARGGVLCHRQRLSEGWVNRVFDEPWLGTRSLRAGDLARYRTLSEVRKQPRETLEFVDGGWHFTSLGGPAAREKKLRSASHEELDLPYYRDLRRLEVAFASAGSGRCMSIDASFPAPIRADPRWSPYVWQGPSLTEPELATALEHAHGCLSYVPGDAASVAVLAAKPLPWEQAGGERFGPRWAGAVADVQGLSRGEAEPQWVVVDQLERFPAGTLAELRRRSANVVAHACNARSFATFRVVLGGGAFPAGSALGLAEYHARILAAGYDLERTDGLRTDDVFVAWPSMPEVMYGVTVGPIGIGEIGREALRSFLTTAFIFVLKQPN